MQDVVRETRVRQLYPVTLLVLATMGVVNKLENTMGDEKYKRIDRIAGVLTDPQYRGLLVEILNDMFERIEQLEEENRKLKK